MAAPSLDDANAAQAQRLADARDLDALAGHLRRYPPRPIHGEPLLHHVDPRVGHLIISWLRRHLRRCADAEVLTDWARVIPRDVARFGPRAQRGLARLYSQVRAQVQALGAVLPDWRACRPAEPVAVAWLSTAIEYDPQSVTREGSTERLLHALSSLTGAELTDAGAVLDALLPLADATPALVVPAMRLLFEARTACTLSAETAQAVLLRWIAAGHATALHTSRAWPQLSIPLAVLEDALADPLRAADAVSALTRQGNGLVLLEIAEGVRPGPTAQALAAVGAFAPTAASLIDLARRDPLQFAAPLRLALIDAHRRGIFVQPADLVPLLTLFVAHRGWPALDLVDLCHVARDALVERIAARPIDDPAWLRLLPVLAISPGRGASAAIRAILGAPAPPTTVRAALGTVAVREDTEAEGVVLARLAEYCPEALRALTRVGGAATAQTLEVALGLSDAPAEPWILAHQTPALVLLWQLTPARSTARAALLARINPGEIPPQIARDIAAERSEAARRLALKSALFVRPDQALIRLADLGEDGAFDTLYGLLRETVVGLIDGAVPGDSPLDTAHTVGRPDLPASVRDALLKYGQRLAGRGRIRPVSLARGGEPGAAMMVDIALDLALFGGLEPAMQRCLLDAIQPYDVPGVAARLEPLIRSRDPQVRAAAVRLFVARVQASQTHALIRLLRDEAPATLRPAIAAMAEFAVVWATPLVVARLGHSDLEVARAAADALVRLDPVEAAPAVVAQLAERDDPRLRSLLLKAYVAADLGPGPLVDALVDADPTARVRLLQALDARMSPAWLRRLVVANHPAAPQLIEALQAGKVRLDGSIERLDDELVRHGRPRIRPGPVTILERLRRAGWSAADGRAAIADPAVDLQSLVRRFGREVVALLPHLSPEDRDRVAAHLEGLKADTARQGLSILLDALSAAVEPAAAEGLMRLLMRIGSGLPSPLAGRAVDAVRGLTSTLAGGAADEDAGALRWQTLERLGAIPTRADLAAALADTQFAPDPVQAAIEVLRWAFGARRIPAQPPADLLSADDGALAAARARETGGSARVGLIGELIAAWPHAQPERAQLLLDWLLELQPLGAPPWILSADRMRPPAPVHEPSMTRRAALLDGLNDDDPARRTDAAVQLLDWSDVPEAQLEVLLAWLDSAIDVPVDRRWALADALHARPRLLTNLRGIELLDWLSVERQRHHADRLWGLWGSDDSDLSVRAGQMLRRLGPEFLLPRVAREISDARWGAADLLIDRPVVRSPLLEMVIDQLRAAGQLDRANTLERQASAGPLSTPMPLPAPRIKRRVSGHEALIETARGDDPRAARAALKQMVDADAPGTLDLLVDLTRHPDPARRILALRAVRQLADQRTYLDAALPFLDDPRPDVRRSVIEALSEARHPKALPELIPLLRDKTPAIRDAAGAGVIRYGAAAIVPLEEAMRHARPDRRGLYLSLLKACRDRRGR